MGELPEEAATVGYFSAPARRHCVRVRVPPGRRNIFAPGCAILGWMHGAERAGSVLDHPAISRRVFHPQRATDPPTLVVESGGHRLGCYVRRGHPDAGWVIYFHGNGELAADSEKYCGDLFTGAGVNVCFAEYRGYGTSDGEAALAGMLGDGERVVAALGQPVERVAAFGRSIGSLYAIELAHRCPRLGGLVLESGIAVLTEIWPFQREAEIIGCTASEMGTAVGALFDHRAKLGGFTGPQLVLHAAGDHLVSVTHGARLHAWGAGREKRRVFFPQGDHNTIMGANAVQYAAALQEFLRDIGLAAVQHGRERQDSELG